MLKQQVGLEVVELLFLVHELSVENSLMIQFLFHNLEVFDLSINELL